MRSRLHVFLLIVSMLGAALPRGGVLNAAPAANRLIHEKSPYLLRHAHNPVDWYPWGDEAFQKARTEDRPIFLSIGYSTCHWCHVMELESFESAEIARVLNENFVAIKVDREERPDVDGVYMPFVHALTRSGGWPMTVFLTPDLKPFYAGTYFPPEPRDGRPGLKELLLRIARLWKTDRKEITTSADNILAQLAARARQSQAVEQLEPSTLDRGVASISQWYDIENGGFGTPPKFANPSLLGFLLRMHARTGDAKTLQMVVHSLERMHAGGVRDILGGGFHRYSVDAQWHLPHFEKMLYDQAQLAILYLEAYQVTGRREFADTARDTLDYVLRDMTDQRGGFYSAEDADSAAPGAPDQKAEGRFYTWTYPDLVSALGARRADIVAERYGIPREQRADEGVDGRSVLRLAVDVPTLASRHSTSVARLEQLLEAANDELLAARARRPRPPRDDKIITAWNGLMISACARGYSVLGDARYLAAAQRASAFVLANLRQKDGALLRRWREGQAAAEAHLTDYAFLIAGLLDLYEADFDVSRLQAAIKLQETQDSLFWGAGETGYFDTSGRDPSVIVRSREIDDRAEPSGNSVSALNLARLAEITGRAAWRERAVQTARSLLGRGAEKVPATALAAEFLLSKPVEVVIAGRPRAADTEALLQVVRRRFLPHHVLLLADGGEGQRALARFIGVIGSMKPVDGRATAYVCQDFRCSLPTADPAVLSSLLDKASTAP